MNTGKKGLSGSALKWIAIVTMFIDHVGAVVLTRMLLNFQYAPGLTVGDDSYVVLYWIMYTTRMIGRLAFPIFCFLLVEGFQRTGNVHKYMLRMTLFAMIAEIPFDLALSSKVLEGNYQNVMLTLLIGLLTMYACSLVEKRFVANTPLMVAGCILCFLTGMLLADWMKTDYGAKGVMCIMVLYFLRHNKTLQTWGGALSFCWEAPAMLAFPFISRYNGQRGMKMKYFFYLFYPIHLLVLYIICVLLKINGFSAV